MHHQSYNKGSSQTRKSNPNLLSKISFERLWNSQSQTSNRNSIQSKNSTHRCDVGQSSPVSSSLNASIYFNKIRIGHTPTQLPSQFIQSGSFNQSISSIKLKQLNPMDKEEQQNKILGLEKENKLLQEEFMKISKKYVQLAEQYVLCNQKLQQQASSQTNLEKHQTLKQQNGNSFKNLISQQLKFLAESKAQRKESSSTSSKLKLMEFQKIINKLKIDLEYLQLEFLEKLNNYKDSCMDQIQKLEETIWVESYSIQKLKEENSKLTQQMELINIEKGDLLFYGFELEDKIGAILEREERWKQLINIFVNPLCKQIGKTQIIEIVSKQQPSSLEWINKKLDQLKL